MTASSAAKKKRSFGKKVRRLLWYTFLGLFIISASFFAYVWFYPMDERDIWDFVPQDAVYVVEADNPIENWKTFSDTKIWQHLKKNDLFADIEADANYLDTLIHDNGKVLNLISGKKLLLVAQMYKADDYDFLYLMDLKKGAKVSFFMDIFKPIINAFGVDMHSKKIGEHSVYGIGEGADELLLGFTDNIMLMSFSKKLFIESLKQYKKPHYPQNKVFKSAHSRTYKLSDDESLVKLHMNFDQLDEFMKVYMDDVSGMITNMSEFLEFVSLDVKMKDEHAELSGYIAVDDSVPSMFTVMQKVEHGPVRAHQILPRNTSLMLAMDYNNFDTLYSAIATLMKDDKGFKDFEKTKKSVGGFLGLRVKERKAKRREKRGKDNDFFDWIGNEISLAMLPMNGTGSQQAYVCMIHSPDRENAMRDLETIGKKIPGMRFKKYEYRGHEIRYLHISGFFRLFLGKLLKQFDQPKYTVLDDFVVFSNDTAAVHRIIDVSDGKAANLPMDPGFRNFFKRFETESNYFLYVNTHELYGHLPGLFGKDAAKGVRKNKKYITCFPKVGLQLGTDKSEFKAKLFFEFDTEKKSGFWSNFGGS